MARKKHDDSKPAKKVAKKKVGKKKAGKSLLERASAKKRSGAAAATMAPTLTRPSTNKDIDPKIVLAKKGEHPVDTLAAAKAKTRTRHGTSPRSPIDRERSEFLKGPLTEVHIELICTQLRYTLHRETIERLLGLGSGRIKRWIRMGKDCREGIEAWHDSHAKLERDKAKPAEFRRLGPEPE